MVEAVVSSVIDEINEVCPKALSRRARLLIRLAFFILFFVAGIPLIMEVLLLVHVLHNKHNGWEPAFVHVEVIDADMFNLSYILIISYSKNICI